MIRVAFALIMAALWGGCAPQRSPFGGLSDVFDERRLLEIYIPTVNSADETCRNDSRFYAHELTQFRIWATEMFDASGKMPSGFLYGSSHDLGNFDECMEIRVPRPVPLRGQYCLAQFTVAPPAGTSLEHASSYYESDYLRASNDSMWAKLAVYAQDKTKGSRNELYFAFCLPSSCDYRELRSVLTHNAAILNNRSDFQVTVDVGSCQAATPTRYTAGDVAFIVFLCVSLATVLLASGYEMALTRDSNRHWRLMGKRHELALCFSLPSNVRKLTAQGRNLDGLDCLAGMRVYSMLLIVLLHRIMFEFGSPMVNPKDVEKLYTQFETTLLLNGPILVETFFTLSGFLATYLMLGELQRKKGRVQMGAVYLHRVVRMTPTYAVVLAFYCTLLVKLGSGPFWQQRVGLEQQRCLASWWANLLYINNYVNTDQICMFQSWYITCDMNFFLFTPLLAWLLWKRPKVGVAVVGVLILASMLVVFAIVYVNKMDAMFMLYIKVLKDPVAHDTFKTLYIPGHMRGSSYLVGVLTGYIKHAMKEGSAKLPKAAVRIGKWQVGRSAPPSWWPPYTPALCSICSRCRPCWPPSTPPSTTLPGASALRGWCWPSALGVAVTWVEPMLRWRPLVVLARLTYCVYISHGAIQMYTAATIRTPIYASVFNVEYQTAADLLLAYALALALTLMYESPVIALEKVLLSPAQGAAAQGSLEMAA
ncbi:hypothetical protein HUJ04_000087 [Dendroctonus ponderosae]|nr:hypothetical protein HUJ04_000087 [Dendroctonus ponderosae]KAH1000161.1 hypothetical protein HUJ04_000087 [Dendroctonus ponderosae]